MNKDIEPSNKLKFAKKILLCLMFLFVLGSISEILIPENNVFEACRTILPSIVTLVIGYYFGKM